MSHRPPFRVATPLLAAILLAAGCNEYQVVEDPNGVAGAVSDQDPDIQVDPESIDFGSIDVADGTPSTQVVSVLNVGQGDLHIFDLGLDDPGAPFEIGALGSVLVPPGQATDFSVTFHPETAVSAAASAVIESDDPDEPTVEVPLLGEGLAPVIQVDPVEYDFGTLYVGCQEQQPISVSNVGNADLEVLGFTYTSGSTDLVFDPSGEYPSGQTWALAPGEHMDVTVEYAPLDEYQDIGYLAVDSTDPFTPTVMASQSGTGAIYDRSVDIFEQPLEGMTDILFALDWSCSMYDDLANVSNNFDAFISTLDDLDADYHVAAVIEDDGCILGSQPYIDNTFGSSSAQSLFDDMVNFKGNGCHSCSNTERLFSLFEAALSSANSSTGGCNDGFMRDDAMLALVAVSDESEQSAPRSESGSPCVGTCYTVTDPDNWVALFQSKKSDPDNLVMHAIAADQPGSGGYSCGASYDDRYYNTTVATGGLYLSICATDWGSNLEALAEGSQADLSSFELTGVPVPDTITVKVDGLTQTSGWSYDAVDNSVDFEADYIPAGGATIEVDYALMGDCEQ